MNPKDVREKLALALSQREEKQPINSARLAPSAVLVPIFLKEGEYHLLFTKRTERVKSHKGQISFPGGARHKDDRTLLDTALRESTEEIGLSPDAVELVGKLDDVVTVISSYLVSPFVAFIPWPYPFKLQEDEVKELVEVPISALLNKNTISTKNETIEGKEVTELHYRYKGRIIWGATARILDQFLDIFAQAIQIDRAES